MDPGCCQEQWEGQTHSLQAPGRQQPACYLGGEVKCQRRHKDTPPADRSPNLSRECLETGPANNAAKEDTNEMLPLATPKVQAS